MVVVYASLGVLQFLSPKNYIQDKIWANKRNVGDYRNDPKFSDTQNICCNHSKVWTMWLYHRLMSPNDVDGMANSVDPDQTAPLGEGWG